MGQCKDCKLWIPKQGTKLGTCDHPKHLTGYQWNPKGVPIDGLVVEDDEGWGWFSGREFGCVNFETQEINNG